MKERPPLKPENLLKLVLLGIRASEPSHQDAHEGVILIASNRSQRKRKAIQPACTLEECSDIYVIDIEDCEVLENISLQNNEVEGKLTIKTRNMKKTKKEEEQKVILIEDEDIPAVSRTDEKEKDAPKNDAELSDDNVITLRCQMEAHNQEMAATKK